MSNVVLHGLREPSIGLRGPSTDRENPVSTLRWHSVGLRGPSVDLRKTKDYVRVWLDFTTTAAGAKTHPPASFKALQMDN